MSSVCYCTPLLFLLLSGDQLQGGDQKDGVALIQRKVVVPSYQVVSYITIQLSSQWKHGPCLKEFWPLSQVSAPTASLFQWNMVGEKSVCLFLTISLLSALRVREDQLNSASSHNLRLISIRLDGGWIWSELCKKDSLTFHAIDAWVDSPHVLANDAVPLASVSDGPVSSQLFGAMDHCRGPLQTRLWVCVWNAWSVSLERRFLRNDLIGFCSCHASHLPEKLPSFLKHQ